MFPLRCRQAGVVDTGDKLSLVALLPAASNLFADVVDTGKKLIAGLLKQCSRQRRNS